MSRYGQYHAPEPLCALFRHHRHDATALDTVMHEPPLAVLDQQDLLKQGIHTSAFIPGCKTDADALGSCTSNALTAHLSAELPQDKFFAITGLSSYSDAVGAEKFAILTYHGVTDQTGTPAQEWPPTDCGSSGPYLYQYAKAKGWISTERIATSPDDLVSLLQKGTVLQGAPFLNAWEEPAPNGMIDGNGSIVTLESQLQSGVAGGHETLLVGTERLVLTGTGAVDAANTIVRARNSWSPSWGDHGDYLVHLSTLMALSRYIDWRQFVA